MRRPASTKFELNCPQHYICATRLNTHQSLLSMVDQGSKKKRKAATEQVPPKQPIEALQRYKELHASWPEDVKALLSEELPQVLSHYFFMNNLPTQLFARSLFYDGP